GTDTIVVRCYLTASRLGCPRTAVGRSMLPEICAKLLTKCSELRGNSRHSRSIEIASISILERTAVLAPSIPVSAVRQSIWPSPNVEKSQQSGLVRITPHAGNRRGGRCPSSTRCRAARVDDGVGVGRLEDVYLTGNSSCFFRNSIMYSSKSHGC